MNCRKAIYILGAGTLGLNIIKWAKELDIYTIVTDINKTAEGFQYADKFFVVSILDINTHLSIMENLKKEFEIIGIYCGVEIGLDTIYCLNKVINKPYLSKEILNIVQDKIEMKKIWQKDCLPTPKMKVIDNLNMLNEFINKYNKKFIIKPSKGSGSRGVKLISKNDNIKNIFKESLNSVNNKGKLIIEEYIDNSRLIDVNGIFIDDKFYPAGILEKYETNLPYFLPIGGNDPVDISEQEKEKIYNIFEKACRSLGINIGIVKGDLIRDNNGNYFILEVSPRFHGDVTTSNTLPFGSNINPVKFYFNYLKNQIIDTSFLYTKIQNYAIWRVIMLPPGKIIKTFNVKKQHSQITKIWINPKIKDEIFQYTDTSKIFGYICGYGKNKKEIENIFENFFKENKIEIKLNPKYKQWYQELGKQLEKHRFSKLSCGYQENCILSK